MEAQAEAVPAAPVAVEKPKAAPSERASVGTMVKKAAFWSLMAVGACTAFSEFDPQTKALKMQALSERGEVSDSGGEFASWLGGLIGVGSNGNDNRYVDKRR